MDGKVCMRVLLILSMLLGFSSYATGADSAIQVTRFEISGNKVLSEQVFSGIFETYVGKEMEIADLEKVASLVTNEYRKRGYTIAKAYIPEQKVSDGVVKVAVLEGRVGHIRIEGNHPFYPDDFIMKYFEPVMKKEAFHQQTMERAVLLLNDFLKLNVKTALQAGKEPGTTDVIVKAENMCPMQWAFDYNNFGSKYVSRDRFGAQLDLGNILKTGSLLSIRGVSGGDPSDLLYGRGQYTLPLNAQGTKLGVYYARGDFDVVTELADLGITGREESWGFFINHPFIRKTNLSVSGEFGFDSKNVDQFMLDTDASSDRIRSVRAGLSAESIDASGRFFSSVFLTQGLGNNFGGMTDNDPNASRANGDNRFTRANLEVMRLQKIADQFYVILKLSGQWSPDPLVVSETFSIGGPDSVRGYPYGEYLGDLGYTATAELRYSPFAEKKDLFQVAAFLDSGWVRIKNAPDGQKSEESLIGGGFGLRLSLPQNLNIRADLGFPIDPSYSSEGTSPMFYFQLVKKF
jgi:hemolysin activation/secretion protein